MYLTLETKTVPYPMSTLKFGIQLGIFSGEMTLSTTKEWERKAPKVRKHPSTLKPSQCLPQHIAHLSQVCCIYHKARPVGESSSESESSDSSESDADSDNGADDQTHRNGGRRSRHHMSCDHNSPGHTSSERTSDTGKTRRRKFSPNAYEKMPKTTRGR